MMSVADSGSGGACGAGDDGGDDATMLLTHGKSL